MAKLKNATVLLCNNCKSLVMSRYSGQWVQCECKNIYVDETEHYARMGGNPGDFQQFQLPVDWTKTLRPFSRTPVDWSSLNNAEYLARLFNEPRGSAGGAGDNLPRKAKAKGKSKVVSGTSRKKLSNRKGRKV